MPERRIASVVGLILSEKIRRMPIAIKLRWMKAAV